MQILGIDIGGSGIKGAPVDIKKGTLTAERHRIPTPQPSLPEDVGNVVAEIVRHFEWKGPIGCTFPAIIKDGVAYSAANVDPSWIGTNGQQLITEKTGCSTILVNDAGAAGIAEMEFGAGRGEKGLVILLTLGTGIGSAFFINGILVPNTELGHLEIRGKDAEARASDRVREEKDLSWSKWGGRVNEFLQHLDFIFSPDLFIIGGGISKRFDRFIEYIDVNAKVVPAKYLNDSGIIGAAMAAAEVFSKDVDYKAIAN